MRPDEWSYNMKFSELLLRLLVVGVELRLLLLTTTLLLMVAKPPQAAPFRV